MLNFYQKRTLSNTIRLMTILYMLCICQLAIAQTKNFQGVVKDAKGNTLPGVTILETGTSNGVSTNIANLFLFFNPRFAFWHAAFIKTLHKRAGR